MSIKQVDQYNCINFIIVMLILFSPVPLTVFFERIAKQNYYTSTKIQICLTASVILLCYSVHNTWHSVV